MGGAEVTASAYVRRIRTIGRDRPGSSGQRRRGRPVREPDRLLRIRGRRRARRGGRRPGAAPHAGHDGAHRWRCVGGDRVDRRSVRCARRQGGRHARPADGPRAINGILGGYVPVGIGTMVGGGETRSSAGDYRERSRGVPLSGRRDAVGQPTAARARVCADAGLRKACGGFLAPRARSSPRRDAAVFGSAAVAVAAVVAHHSIGRAPLRVRRRDLPGLVVDVRAEASGAAVDIVAGLEVCVPCPRVTKWAVGALKRPLPPPSGCRFSVAGRHDGRPSGRLRRRSIADVVDPRAILRCDYEA